ncbi:hypothetical protein Gocc_2890 [Gaiella occulta]|uniref:Uncharacterized protein n=1 Tax=Gaiella occulta TaxID=1002870 RepID=A0A7M2YU73_9ACTN|nr:hypothetical protein [Gaiella occulta]RDI73290.1 hypothetical protein Gocc_2890 [Gaiella occulta]
MTATDTAAGLVMPDGTTVPLESDEATQHIHDVMARAHGVDPDTGELFDTKPYDRPVPKLDGRRANVLKLAFGGQVAISMVDEEQLDHYASLRFGDEVELRVTATVGKHGWALRIGPDGDEKVTHTVGLHVHSYRIAG